MPEVLCICVWPTVLCVCCLIADLILPKIPAVERFIESPPMCWDDDDTADYMDADYEPVE